MTLGVGIIPGPCTSALYHCVNDVQSKNLEDEDVQS